MSDAKTSSQRLFEAAAAVAEAKYRHAEAKQMHKLMLAVQERRKAMGAKAPNEQPQQPPAHHFDPDMADAILLAMLDNPHHADAIASLSDEELNQIAADVPLNGKRGEFTA